MTETLLVIGANGYLAQHVIQQALTQGWNVLGTARSQSSASKVLANFPQDASSSNNLDLVYIQDIIKPEHLEPAFTKTPITAVINTASPVLQKKNPKDVRAEIIDPAIQSGVAILEAAARYGGSSLKRVVHTSSFAAILDLSKGLAPGKTYTSSDWNPMTYEDAVTGGDAAAYVGSKALAEKAMWEWMQDHTTPTSNFDLAVINPSVIFGPQVGPADLDHLNVSSQILWELIEPSHNPSPWHSFHMGAYVDVRDVAAALLAAVKVPEAGGERFIVAQRCHWQFIRDEARRMVPESRDWIEPGEPGVWEGVGDTVYDVDGSKAEKVLGVRYRSLGECLKDSYLQLLEAQKRRQAVLS